MRFDSYHPTINLIYFAAVITATVRFLHPVFVALSLLCSFVYSVKLCGRRALLGNFALLLLALAWALWFASYRHFGVTELARNFIGNRITLESLVYGLVTGVTACSVVFWLRCVHAVFCTDKIVYLFGRVSPRLALFLSVLLRWAPRVRAQSRRIDAAQNGIGRGKTQGKLFRRIANALREFSILLTWTSENFLAASESMRSRGTTLRGRTAFSIYRFDNRDRSFVIAIFECLTVLLAGDLLDQTNIHYDPQIIWNRITPLSGVFYAAYAVLCLLPMALQILGERRMKRLAEKTA